MSANPNTKKGPVLRLGGRYHVVKREPERPAEITKRKRDRDIKVNQSLNEVDRAQRQINKILTERAPCDTKMLANPVWRSIDKKSWVTPFKSFEYKRPDTDVNKLKSKLNTSQQNPYVDVLAAKSPYRDE